MSKLYRLLSLALLTSVAIFPGAAAGALMTVV